MCSACHGLCLGPVQMLALGRSHKRPRDLEQPGALPAPGQSPCLEGLLMVPLSKHQQTLSLPPAPSWQAPNWASGASGASSSGVGTRAGQDSVR